MYDIDSTPASKEFLECWQATGRHIQSWGGRGVNWIKADPYPPFLEHFSFFYGNQVYFVRIEDADGILDIPGNPTGFLSIARAWGGHACRIVMRKRGALGWKPVHPGWALQDVESGEFLNPKALATDEKIEIGPWELFDFASQVVRDALVKKGYDILSSGRNPDIFPSIWVDSPKGREWILVTASRFPELTAAIPEGFTSVKKELELRGYHGNLAHVVFRSLNPEDKRIIRGEGADVDFQGLKPL